MNVCSSLQQTGVRVGQGLLLGEPTTSIVGQMHELLYYWTDHIKLILSYSYFVLGSRASDNFILTTHYPKPWEV
jgi:hypothetical protein